MKLLSTPLWKTITLWAIICLFLCMLNLSYGNWEEVPAHGITLDLGGLLNDKASSYTTQAMYAGKHGWVGLQANEIRADGEIISQTIDARVQGGNAWLQLFVEGNRNMDTDLATSIGFYLRHTRQLDKVGLTFGAGTFAEREDIRADLGLEETDPTVLPYLLATVSGRYQLNDDVGFNARIIGTPEARFGHLKGTGL